MDADFSKSVSSLPVLNKANDQTDDEQDAEGIGVCHKEKEELVVAITNTIVDPGTVVIHL